MNRNITIISIVVFSAFILFGFNNCANDMAFKSAGELPTGTNTEQNTDINTDASTESNTTNSVTDSSTSTGTSNNNTTTTIITDEVVETIVSTLPPDEVENPRPITDLVDHPELYETYKCPDSDGVVICHFPENLEAQGTQCVGRGAVEAHFSHIRTYSSGGESKTIQDYLGPCRIAL